ncbi:MAG TPA: hypothetical protein VMY18_10485 [Acidobacteriota bacterium]|nr:hypothetical protein [Acidobacteriota bacterium]
MPSFLILVSLVLMLAGCFFSPFLLALGIVSLIVALASLGGAPRGLLLLFWSWMLALLSVLVLNWMFPGALWKEDDLVFGLPGSTFLMLFGVWVVPVLILPLGFLLTFHRWYQK